jgi:hypothetical protein
MAQLSHLAGGLWRGKLDNCEINLAAPSASRYFSIQFFASLEKVDRRKKSRANREQLRCCNWIRLPNWANPRTFGGEGGKKVKPEARIFVRSTSFVPARAVREKTSSQKEE